MLPSTNRGPVNSPHKWPVTRKMFPFDDVIMKTCHHWLLVWGIPWNPHKGSVVGYPVDYSQRAGNVGPESVSMSLSMPGCFDKCHDISIKLFLEHSLIPVHTFTDCGPLDTSSGCFHECEYHTNCTKYGQGTCVGNACGNCNCRYENIGRYQFYDIIIKYNITVTDSVLKH